ncbi:hypothetical protein L3Y34_004230 [Caenorhabditis briggsae]|nr:hypothetical protein L3Y34_004230 [Caenorhabditis briggsae]
MSITESKTKEVPKLKVNDAVGSILERVIGIQSHLQNQQSHLQSQQSNLHNQLGRIEKNQTDIIRLLNSGKRTITNHKDAPESKNIKLSCLLCTHEHATAQCDVTKTVPERYAQIGMNNLCTFCFFVSNITDTVTKG